MFRQERLVDELVVPREMLDEGRASDLSLK
jgi:hypothetical protein